MSIHSEKPLFSTMSYSFSFDKPVIEYASNQYFSHISVNNCSPKHIPGYPIIPYKPIQILLPPGSTNVSITSQSNFLTIPLSKPVKKSSEITPFMHYDCTNKINNSCSKYDSSHIYPSKQVESIGIMYYRGYSILSLVLYPVQYNSAKEEILYAPTIEVSLCINTKNNYQNMPKTTDRNQTIEQLIINPEMITSYSMSLNTNIKDIQYVIITTEELKNNFIPLQHYKQQYITTAVVTKEEIIANKEFWVNGTYGDATNYSQGNMWIQNGDEITQNYTRFNSSAAKLRNFIRFSHEQWNTQYILLGGDTELIPSQSFYGYIPNWSAGKIVKPMQGLIVSDYYFAALDGTWNADMDQYFGEERCFSIKDEADFYSEISIGRAPVNDQNEVNLFVKKIISYETSPKPTNITLHQSYTNPERIPDTVPVAESCAQWVPPLYSIKRIYEQQHIITRDIWLDLFASSNQLLIYHVGNGYNDGLSSWYQLSWEDEKRINFDVLDVGSLNNSFYPIHLSISCLTGDFSDNECLMEELLLTAQGGPSACITNSEVGCIAKDDATAYSSEFFEQIFIELFQNEEIHLGTISQHAKEQFTAMAASQHHYRWCFYVINLLGDPETPVLKVREPINYNYDSFYVDDDFTRNTSGWNVTHFNRIQSAINKIDEFGTILLHEGEYHEPLLINKTIILKGANKTKTILTTSFDEQKPIISLQCHSTIISNVTLINREKNEKHCTSLIHILPDHNGNIITNSIISGNNGYGIFIEGSIRNRIEGNSIINNTCGIAIINFIDELLPSKIIVTCNNILSNNLIKNNSNCGIYIEGSIHNYILKNTFLQNGNHQIDSLFYEPDLRLVRTRWNYIKNNYWNIPHTGSYPLMSFNGPVMIFSFDFSRGLIFQLYKCILIINIGYPLIVYDIQPSSTPLLQ